MTATANRGRIRLRAIAGALLLSLCGIAAADEGGNAIALAQRTLDRLDAGQYAAVIDSFTAEAKAAIDADGLEQVWIALPAQLGEAQGRGDATLDTRGRFRVVAIPLRYARGALNAIVTLDEYDRVAGLLLQPPAAAPPPPPTMPAGISERAFSVGSGERALPGTLTLPNGAGPFPAVVLVHGSGPQDRDETIGPNRPFLDIARGLADNGIAVLRYEKRTKARPQDFAGGQYTMDEETTNDAVAAVAALRATPGIDPDRIYILGHSQGGMLAPRIAQHSGKVAGLILLAAPARSLLTILPEQNHYLLNADGNITAQEQQFLDQLQQMIANVRSDATIADKDTPLGLPAHYWRTFDKIDPVADAQSLTLPMLLLQGGRDFQVIDTDWQLWRKAFADAPRATFHHYPALNHLGIAGEGAGSLDEYQKPGHVDAKLIADVAAWIKEH